MADSAHNTLTQTATTIIVEQPVVDHLDIPYMPLKTSANSEKWRNGLFDCITGGNWENCRFSYGSLSR